MSEREADGRRVFAKRVERMGQCLSEKTISFHSCPHDGRDDADG